MWRKIGLGLAGVVAVAAVGFFALAPAYVERAQNGVEPLAKPPSPTAQKLHDALVIGDWHSDALLWHRDLTKRADRGHVDLPRLREGNVGVQVFTTVTKSPSGLNYEHNSAEAGDDITLLVIGQLRPPRTWFDLTERALDQAARLSATAEAAPDQLRILRTRGDLATLLADRAAGARVVGGLIGAEGGHALQGDLANLDRLYAAGFRLMGLTHFFDNELGGSLHGDSGGNGAGTGLTPFGREVVQEMQKRGMVIDLAHASPQMVRDVLAMPGTRPIVSHTGIYSQCETHRNLPDDLMQAIAAKGGVIGIGFWADVTCDASPDGVAAAIVAAVALVGADHVSLGSDFDGAVTTGFDASQLASLTDALLRAGVHPDVIAKVMGGNMMRTLAETLPE
jgi:microsomal dipeptidase-like Zn-dependent dipeptidase